MPTSTWASITLGLHQLASFLFFLFISSVHAGMIVALPRDAAEGAVLDASIRLLSAGSRDVGGRASHADARGARPAESHRGPAPGRRRARVHAAEQGFAEGTSEGARHEAVHERVDAAVQVGQQVEAGAQGFQVGVVERRDAAECREHVQDQDRGPAEHEEADDQDEHFDHLQC